MSELKNAELSANSLFEQFITKKQFITDCARRTIEHYRNPRRESLDSLSSRALLGTIHIHESHFS